MGCICSMNRQYTSHHLIENLTLSTGRFPTMQSGLCSLVDACQMNTLIYDRNEIVLHELMTIDFL